MCEGNEDQLMVVYTYLLNGMAKRYGISFFCIVITAECQ